MYRSYRNNLAFLSLSLTAVCFSAAPANAQFGDIFKRGKQAIDGLKQAKKTADGAKEQFSSAKDMVVPGKADEKALAAFDNEKMPTLVVVDVRDNNGGQLPTHLGQPLAGVGENGNPTAVPIPGQVTPDSLRALTIMAIQKKLGNCLRIKDWNPLSGEPMPKADLLLEVDVTGITGKSTTGHANNIPLLNALQVGVEDAEIKSAVKLISGSDHIILATVKTQWRARQQAFSTVLLSQAKSGDLGDAFYGAALAAGPALRVQIETWMRNRQTARQKQPEYLEAHLSGQEVTVEIDPQWDTMAANDLFEVYRVSTPILDATDGHLKGYVTRQLIGVATVIEVEGELVRCRWQQKPDLSAIGEMPQAAAGAAPLPADSKIVARRKQ